MATPGMSAPIHAAFMRLARTLVVLGAVIVLVEVVCGFAVAAQAGTVVIAACASIVLVGAQIVTLRVTVKHPQMLLAGVAGGYLVKIVLIFGAVKLADYLGFDIRFVGIAVVLTVLVVLQMEILSLMKSRIPNVDPPRSDSEN
ncbi:hypothetical protein [Schaalia suimastitidis]|uniref:hypothetical protein n=1 Tax=Schaalia suimastitidis TaxID=121163 RepID=UPI0003F5B0B2|nr:hypothetical protein [Schaalia suimastitidis]